MEDIKPSDRVLKLSDLVAFLNYVSDIRAFNYLFRYRVNMEGADLEVKDSNGKEVKNLKIGMIGALNGILTLSTNTVLSYKFDSDGNIVPNSFEIVDYDEYVRTRSVQEKYIQPYLYKKED